MLGLCRGIIDPINWPLILDSFWIFHRKFRLYLNNLYSTRKNLKTFLGGKLIGSSRASDGRLQPESASKKMPYWTGFCLLIVFNVLLFSRKLKNILRQNFESKYWKFMGKKSKFQVKFFAKSYKTWEKTRKCETEMQSRWFLVKLKK